MYFDLKTIDRAAIYVADLLQKYRVILLSGPLGAGKTTLTAKTLHYLGVIEPVTSPTYTIMQQYITEQMTIWHCDLYRIKNINELTELGIYEMWTKDFMIIEWPEKLQEYLPPQYAFCELSLNGNQRALKTLGSSNNG